jgi:hypothetical protein
MDCRGDQFRVGPRGAGLSSGLSRPIYRELSKNFTPCRLGGFFYASFSVYRLSLCFSFPAIFTTPGDSGNFVSLPPPLVSHRIPSHP